MGLGGHRQSDAIHEGWGWLNWELEQFEATMAEIVERAPTVAAFVVKQVAFGLFTDVTEDTPVLTGRARAAWLPAFAKLGMKEPPKKGNAEGIAAGRAEGHAEADLTGHRPPYIQITNGVNYIVPLEFGHSSKSPDGMLRRNLARHRKYLRENLKKFGPQTAGKA